MDWNFAREESNRNKDTGIRRCVITDVEARKSQAGNDMIVVTVRPSGSTANVCAYMVKNQYFNRNMTDFYDAFTTIPEGNFEFASWIGAEGAAYFVPDDRNPMYLKVKFFVTPDKAKDLPPFVGERPVQQEITTFEPVDDASGIPF